MKLLSEDESDKNSKYLMLAEDKIGYRMFRLFRSRLLGRLANYMPFEDWKDILDREVEEFKKGK